MRRSQKIVFGSLIALSLAVPGTAFAAGGTGGARPVPAPVVVPVVVPAPPPAPAGCRPTAAVLATTGYTPGGGNTAAIWTTYSVGTCPGRALTFDIVQVDLSTGLNTPWSRYGVPLTGALSRVTFDNDWVPFSTAFSVDLTIRDRATGAVVSTAHAISTTPRGKAGGV